MTAKKCIICGNLFGLEGSIIQRKKSHCMDCKKAWSNIKKQKVYHNIKFKSRLGLTRKQVYNWQTRKKYVDKFGYVAVKTCDDALLYERGAIV